VNEPSEIHVLRQDRHMWPEPANTFLLADDEGAIIIDAGCGWPERYARLVEFLASHGFKPADVHTVVLSHAHPDHMGAMPFLLEEASPRVFIHPLEKALSSDPRLLNQSFDMCFITDYYSERLGDTDPASLDILDYFSALCPMGAAEATDLLEDGDLLTLAGREFEAVHTPGHAPGHVAFVGHGVVFGGDCLFAGSIGRTDLPLSDPLALTRSLERFAALAGDTLVYSGHGPATTIRDEKRSNPFLTGAARLIAR